MEPVDRPPAIVRWTRRLEDTAALDGPVAALEPAVRSRVRKRDAWRGAAR